MILVLPILSINWGWGGGTTKLGYHARIYSLSNNILKYILTYFERIY